MMQFPVGNTLFVVLEPGNIRKMREGQPLVLRPKPGTTSIGIVSTPDIIELRRRIQLPTSPEMLGAAIESCKDLPEVDRGAEPATAAVTAAENTENQIALLAGSAETGGEKADLAEQIKNELIEAKYIHPAYELDVSALILAAIERNAKTCDECLDSGLRRVGDGALIRCPKCGKAPLADPREPEKLNTAHKSICELASEIWSIAQAVDNGGGRLESISHELEALAESSLSSPPPTDKNVE